MIARKILVVEDDESLGATLVSRLAEEPYEVQWVKTLSEARSAFENTTLDLILLDVGLPDGSGFSLARDIRHSSKLPIIFLTAMNSAEYRLEGFEIGGDDYIPKPFHLRELLLRVRKVLDGRTVDITKKAGACRLSEEGYAIMLPDGASAELSIKDFELLKFLIAESPRAVAREELVSKVLHSDADTTPRIVDNAVVRIRTALGSYADGHLRSVRGVGYQWIG